MVPQSLLSWFISPISLWFIGDMSIVKGIIIHFFCWGGGTTVVGIINHPFFGMSIFGTHRDAFEVEMWLALAKLSAYKERDMDRYGGFQLVIQKMDGLYMGKYQSKMDDHWG